MIKVGLYLNELNFQTFEVVEVTDSYCYVRFPDFLYADRQVHADEDTSNMLVLTLVKAITYIGEV